MTRPATSSRSAGAATQKRTAHSCPNVTARRVRPKNSPPPHTAEERYAAYRMLQDEYEQLCVEYVSDYYAERGEEWWPYK